MNEKHELEKRKITRMTLKNYVYQKKVGVSPEKRGPESKILLSFWDLLDCHVSMTQLEEKEETKPRHLKALIWAALKDTPFEDFSQIKLYSRFREKYPDTVNPTRAMEMEERRSLWTTFPNVNRWLMAQRSV